MIPAAEVVVHNPAMRPFVLAEYTLADLDRLESLLVEKGTLNFPSLPNGLFRAAVGVDESTGYQNVWVRDSVHIAHAHRVCGQPEFAVRAASALMTYFLKHGRRFDRVIARLDDHADPMHRPHIRFDGANLDEIAQKWAHAQNDALGYFVWLYAGLARAGMVTPGESEFEMLAAFVRLFATIEYWRDADSGHWEEIRKVAASSIGAVVAGLRELRAFLDEKSAWASLKHSGAAVSRTEVELLLHNGKGALEEILPMESMDAARRRWRRYDAALLFLIYPLQVVDGPAADRILADVRDRLTGPYGIRRYLGDSYWCADYKQLMAAEHRSADFSDSQAARDALLKPGGEAQWCIFDPIVSVIYGKRFAATGLAADYARQLNAWHRSLGQITGSECRFGPFRCPESYYSQAGRWIPNDITPLLWTQGNLWQAIRAMRESTQLRADG